MLQHECDFHRKNQHTKHLNFLFIPFFNCCCCCCWSMSIGCVGIFPPLVTNQAKLQTRRSKNELSIDSLFFFSFLLWVFSLFVETNEEYQKNMWLKRKMRRKCVEYKKRVTNKAEKKLCALTYFVLLFWFWNWMAEVFKVHA